MQVFGLPGHVIRNGRAASRVLDTEISHQEAAKRRSILGRWRMAMAKGLTAEDAARVVGVPRSTLYRWEKRAEPRSKRPRRTRGRTWSPALVEAVQALRLDNPMWGKRKLVVLLRREGFTVSTSTVGRILAYLVARGVITPVPILRRKPSARRFRLIGQRHAKRLPKGLKPTRPGALVQIDTLFINVRPGHAIKQFTAYDPIAKWTAASVATRATAQSASNILDKLIGEAPFKIEGIQVDGGSEFQAAFEQACQQRGLNLFVLPPKRPELNGAVERAQASWRYEFYACYDLPSRIDKLQALVDAFSHRFNHYRPHNALDGRTPAEYLQALSAKTPASHMC
jgi:putative transposase